MLISIDPRADAPLYRQIVEGVRRLIASGDLAPGEGMPSVRQLAGDLGVNLNTVAEAYRELQRQGLVEIAHGKGAIVAGRRETAGPETVGRLRAALVDMLLAGKTKRQILAAIEVELATLTARRRPT